MNMRLSVTSPRLFACIVTVACSLLGTESKTEEPDKAANPAADTMLGKEPAQVRDDNGLKTKLVWCPPGTFKMGSPNSEKGRIKGEDQVDVTLTKGFWLGRFEVTQSEWKLVMKTDPWKDQKFTKDGADFPATSVSWEEATEFCRTLTEQERNGGQLPGTWIYSLPTQAQWEYACRAGTQSKFSFGDDAAKIGDYAWFHDNAEKAGEKYAHRVGKKKPNPWGLHDMHGNVWEWCRDVDTFGSLSGGRDPETGPDEKGEAWRRVLRGGSWYNVATDARSAMRFGITPDGRDNVVGFRIVLTPNR